MAEPRVGLDDRPDAPRGPEGPGPEIPALAASPPPPRPGRTRELAWQLLPSYADKLRLAGERATAEPGDPEVVHALRVASRRLREALRVFEPLSPASTKQLARRLRKLRHAIDGQRDTEILIENLEELLASASPTTAIVLEELVARLQARHAKGRERLPSLVQKLRVARLPSAVDLVLLDLRAGGADLPARTYAEGILRGARARAEAAESSLAGSSPEPLHALRIALKKLRYEAECFEVLDPEPFARAASELKPRQDVLGRLQDEQVLFALLSGRQDEARSSGRARAAEALDQAARAVFERRERHALEFASLQAERPTSSLAMSFEEALAHGH
jgi:CHAD domain-containing protein